MVTAEEVYNRELRSFCDKFGFDFGKDLIIDKVDREVVLFHPLPTGGGGKFYDLYLKDAIWLREKPTEEMNRLSREASNALEKFAGGSGVLNWDEVHDIVYHHLFKPMTFKQAQIVLGYPDNSIEDVKSAFPGLEKYLPKYIKVFRFIAFIKFIHTPWADLFDKLKEKCEEHNRFLSSTGRSYLPWHWYGEVNDDDHAVIIHESIHNIIMNSGVEKTFERITGKGHNAWNEGIDVFFHRRSGLFLGFYGDLREYIRDAVVRDYFIASNIFWVELSGVNDADLRTVLSDPNDPKTKRVVERILKTWPDQDKFRNQ
jgi:hypothetical protein